MRVKKTLTLLSLVAVAAVFALPAFSHEQAGSWTGFVTDSHCAKKGAVKEHTADCVEKCVKGGGKVQILNEADGKAYDIDGWDKVKGLMGAKVTVKGTPLIPACLPPAKALAVFSLTTWS
jgi:hypothetical protein